MNWIFNLLSLKRIGSYVGCEEESFLIISLLLLIQFEPVTMLTADFEETKAHGDECHDLLNDEELNSVKPNFTIESQPSSSNTMTMTTYDDEIADPIKVNQRRLGQALRDTGNFSNGIVAIDVWIMNHNKTALIRPHGAWWRDPNYRPPLCMDQEVCMASLRKVDDPTADGYVQPQVLQPGFGIAGHLWMENCSVSLIKKPMTLLDEDSRREPKALKKMGIISSFGSYHGVGASSFHSLFGSRKSDDDHRQSRSFSDIKDNQSNMKRSIIWNSLHFMSANPHHVPENRLEILLEAGIGQVAGVPFQVPGSSGIVLLFAKTDTDEMTLNDKANVDYLLQCAPFIGSALALSAPTIATLESKCEFKASCLQRILSNLDTKDELSDSNGCQSNDVQKKKLSLSVSENVAGEETEGFFWKNLAMLREKLFENTVKASPPPSMSNTECIWAFCGAFLSLLFVCVTAESIEFWTDSNNKYAIPIGPFGAFTTLLYTLTAAPPAQPRNAIYGSVIAGCTALCVSYLPSSLLSLRVSLATGLSIALMARFGVTHPPGGALAVILALGDYHWGSLFLYLVADMFVIGIAILINNLNEKRKYPQYWHMIPKFFKKY